VAGGEEQRSSRPETTGRCFMQSLARRRREGVGERPSHPPQPGHAKGHQVARIGGSLARTPAAHPSVRHTRQRAPHRRRASQHPLARRPQCRGSAGSSCNHARGPSRVRRAGAHTGPWRARRPVTSENIVCVPRGQRARQVGWRRRCLYSNGSPRWGVQFNQIVSEASSRDPFVFSTLRQPRCLEWMALVDLMVTL